MNTHCFCVLFILLFFHSLSINYGISAHAEKKNNEEEEVEVAFGAAKTHLSKLNVSHSFQWMWYVRRLTFPM